MSGYRQDLCPACGRDNGCEVARAGSSQARCWCMELALPTGVGPAAGLAQATFAAGTTCFCRDCATNEKAPALARAFPVTGR